MTTEITCYACQGESLLESPLRLYEWQMVLCPDCYALVDAAIRAALGSCRTRHLMPQPDPDCAHCHGRGWYEEMPPNSRVLEYVECHCAIIESIPA